VYRSKAAILPATINTARSQADVAASKTSDRRVLATARQLYPLNLAVSHEGDPLEAPLVFFLGRHGHFDRLTSDRRSRLHFE